MRIAKNSHSAVAREIAKTAYEWLIEDEVRRLALHDGELSAEQVEEWTEFVKGYTKEPDSVAFYSLSMFPDAAHVSGFGGQTTVMMKLGQKLDGSDGGLTALFHGADRRVLSKFKSCVVYRKDYRGNWRESHRV